MGSLYAFGTEIARAIITTWAVYSIIVAVGGLVMKKATWRDIVMALGGILWIVGSVWWRFENSMPDYTPNLVLRAWSFAFSVLPFLIFAGMRTFKE